MNLASQSMTDYDVCSKYHIKSHPCKAESRNNFHKPQFKQKQTFSLCSDFQLY